MSGSVRAIKGALILRSSNLSWILILALKVFPLNCSAFSVANSLNLSINLSFLSISAVSAAANSCNSILVWSNEKL